VTEPLNQQSATAIAQTIAAGETTAEAVTRACLDRIEARDGAVKAWAYIDPEYALAQAQALDLAITKGPLHGVPIGIKDVLDTADMPTEMGSPIYAGHRPMADAAAVAMLRAAGAVILGKTVTCEFAGMHPGATTNPHDPTRTPGGSSSGSAAAVADFHVHGALGTQTGGSVLRPASFCGIVGYKPTYNIINRAGLMFAAENLDTIGFMGRSVGDVDAIAAAILNRPSVTPSAESKPRIGLCRTQLWQTAQPETVEAVEDSAARLAAAGAQIIPIEMPSTFEALAPMRNRINDYERSRVLGYHWKHNRSRISDGLAKQIENGTSMAYGEYSEAITLASESRQQVDAVFDEVDVLLAPAVAGEAPEGLDKTGDPRFQGYWTILHVPTITLPTHKGPNGMPVGIQLVGPRWEDTQLLSIASWAESILE
jgi:Asp-tRNA(Asn)/Glu-tRNA(Gln) amidotransferase A subunit family amidase